MSSSLVVLAHLAACALALPTSLALTQGAAAGAPGAAERAPLPAGVLRIDGREISGEEYGSWLLRSQGEALAREFGLDYWIVDREAKRHGVEIGDAEVRAAVQRDIDKRVLNAFLGRKEEWLAELERTGRSEGGLTRQRFVETKPLLQSKALASIDRVVPEEKIVREWELRHGRHGKRYDVQMIKFKVVVPTLPGATRDEWNAERRRRMEEQREQALAVRAKLAAGEDFGKLAREFSTDAGTRDNRGVPSGGFSHVGWPDVFLDALESLAPGEISEPVYARGGYWLVKVRSVDETPLEEVRAEIEADLVVRGPESDEIGALQARIAQGVEVEILPSMYELERSGEWPAAFEPALHVDGEPVRRGDYARWILHTRGETLARHFTEEWLVEKRARELGIEVQDSEVDARTAEFVQWLIDSGYKGSRESWLAFLTLGGRTEDSYLRGVAWRLRVDLLAEKMIVREREVTPDEVRAHWRDTYGEQGREVMARMIQVSSNPSGADPKWTREELARHMARAHETARAKARDLARRARAGESFAELATSYSHDAATRDRGGALPERFRPEMWSDAVSSAVAALSPGEVTDPVECPGGWLVFQVESVRTVAFEHVASELERELRSRRPSTSEIAYYRNALAKSARVEVLPAMYE